MTAREVLLAWAKSPGFAAIHNGQATDDQIVDDLVNWLDSHEWAMIPHYALRIAEGAYHEAMSKEIS